MTELKVGQEVEVKLRGKIHYLSTRDNYLEVKDDSGRIGGFLSGFTLGTVEVTVLAEPDPDYWPPKFGDVWEDQDGMTWFVRESFYSTGNYTIVPRKGSASISESETTRVEKFKATNPVLKFRPIG